LNASARSPDNHDDQASLNRGPTLALVHNDRQLHALTGLRFFAALTVLLSHFANRGIILMPVGVVAFVDGGRTAVALFFVLSGFILTYNYSELSGPKERRSFYVNRIARIYPVVILALGIGAIGVAYAAILYPEDPKPLLEWYALTRVDAGALVASFISQATVTTGWFPTARINQPWNSPAWSIACEMFFYLLFPALIVWFRGLARNALIAVLLVLAAFQIALIMLAAPAAPQGQRGFLVSQFPVTHLFDFVLGMVDALFFLRGGRQWLEARNRRLIVLIVATAGIVALSALVPIRPAYLPLTPFFALLILGLAANPKRGKSWLAASWLLLLGEASFSLYLIHVPLLNIFSIAALPMWAGWMAVMLTIGASVLVYRFFEVSSRRGLRRLLTEKVGGSPQAGAILMGPAADQQRRLK
jgi:peptidoglycan/LPS O-acetylase OafA/YrhL